MLPKQQCERQNGFAIFGKVGFQWILHIFSCQCSAHLDLCIPKHLHVQLCSCVLSLPPYCDSCRRRQSDHNCHPSMMLTIVIIICKSNHLCPDHPHVCRWVADQNQVALMAAQGTISGTQMGAWGAKQAKPRGKIGAQARRKRKLIKLLRAQICHHTHNHTENRKRVQHLESWKYKKGNVQASLIWKKSGKILFALWLPQKKVWIQFLHVLNFLILWDLINKFKTLKL